MNILKNRKGMTLIEIMIVLAIIGGIAALLLPRLTGQLDKAKTKEARIKMTQVINALQMYYTDCSKFPQSLENLVTADANCSSWGPEAYMKSTPKDPWGRDFVYELTDGAYSLKCLGKDGKEGGSGFDVDITSEELDR